MKERKTKVTFFVALVLLFVGFIGSWLAQTAGGRISVREISFETETGMTMSAILAVPDTATAETPAPAIVTVHGWYNNKEMQELICKGWFLPPNTYDCGSFVVNGTAVVGKEKKSPYNRWKSTQKGANFYEISI